MYICIYMQPNAGLSLLILVVSRSQTTTHHSRWDSSRRVLSLSQRLLHENSQHSQVTDTHDPDEIRTRNLSGGQRSQTYALEG